MHTSCISFSTTKFTGVRASTADAPPPTYTAAPPGCSLSTFRTFTANDVIAAVHHLPDKQCATDPLPTQLLTEQAMGQWVMGQISHFSMGHMGHGSRHVYP